MQLTFKYQKLQNKNHNNLKSAICIFKNLIYFRRILKYLNNTFPKIQTYYLYNQQVIKVIINVYWTKRIRIKNRIMLMNITIKILYLRQSNLHYNSNRIILYNRSIILKNCKIFYSFNNCKIINPFKNCKFLNNYKYILNLKLSMYINS